ncbi:hypothetical protein U1Q18_025961 [Sarracenia purpurea var. burkii]
MKSLGIQSYLAHRCHRTDHRQHRRDDSDRRVAPKDNALSGRLECKIVEHHRQDEVEGDAAKGSEQRHDVAEEREHCCQDGGGDDGQRSED